jgi:hypothetical protein
MIELPIGKQIALQGHFDVPVSLEDAQAIQPGMKFIGFLREPF